MLTQRVRELD